jgi:hypothetical protein
MDQGKWKLTTSEGKGWGGNGLVASALTGAKLGVWLYLGTELEELKSLL